VGGIKIDLARLAPDFLRALFVQEFRQSDSTAPLDSQKSIVTALAYQNGMEFILPPPDALAVPFKLVVAFPDNDGDSCTVKPRDINNNPNTFEIDSFTFTARAQSFLLWWIQPPDQPDGGSWTLVANNGATVNPIV
jgi:hypothetical protein